MSIMEMYSPHNLYGNKKKAICEVDSISAPVRAKISDQVKEGTSIKILKEVVCRGKNCADTTWCWREM